MGALAPKMVRAFRKHLLRAKRRTYQGATKAYRHVDDELEIYGTLGVGLGVSAGGALVGEAERQVKPDADHEYRKKDALGRLERELQMHLQAEREYKKEQDVARGKAEAFAKMNEREQEEVVRKEQQAVNNDYLYDVNKHIWGKHNFAKKKRLYDMAMEKIENDEILTASEQLHLFFYNREFL